MLHSLQLTEEVLVDESTSEGRHLGNVVEEAKHLGFHCCILRKHLQQLLEQFKAILLQEHLARCR